MYAYICIGLTLRRRPLLVQLIEGRGQRVRLTSL